MRMQHHKNRRFGKYQLATAIIGVMVCSPSSAQFSFQSVANTDYVVQGISQTLGDPTLQAGIGYNSSNGLFCGIWAAENSLYSRYGNRKTLREVDYYLGWQTALDSGDAWSATVSHYSYPGEERYSDYAYNELLLSYEYRTGFTGSIGYYDNFYNYNRHSMFAEIAYDVAFSETTVLNFGYGFHNTEKLFGRDYRYWNIGVTQLLGKLNMNLNYINTDSNGIAIFGEQAAGDRWVFSISFSLP